MAAGARGQASTTSQEHVMVSKGDPDRFFLRGHPRFRVEVLDDDVLLVDIQTGVVHRVPGPDVDLLLSGTTTLMSGHLPPGGAEAIRRSLTSSDIGRRSLLVGSGALAATGIISTALPFAAAALSFTYLPPADGGSFETTAWGQADKSGTSANWGLNGVWTAASVATGVANSGGDTRSVQILLHATSGTAYNDDTGSTAIGSGSGAYIVANVQLPIGSPQIYFSLRAGAPGNVNRATGLGGVAVGAYTWDGGSFSTTSWFLVAGAGGGDGLGTAGSGTGVGAPGGRWGVNGGGADPGTRANGGTGGTGGAGERTSLTAQLAETSGQGYDAITGSSVLGRGQNDPSGRPSKVDFYPGASAFGGGGGGAGWASGGGGGTNSGGGGGSSFIRTTGAGPIVTSYVIYSFPREWSSNGSTTRFEVYTA
jgi:hypothetical protein